MSTSYADEFEIESRNYEDLMHSIMPICMENLQCISSVFDHHKLPHLSKETEAVVELQYEMYRLMENTLFIYEKLWKACDEDLDDEAMKALGERSLDRRHRLAVFIPAAKRLREQLRSLEFVHDAKIITERDEIGDDPEAWWYLNAWIKNLEFDLNKDNLAAKLEERLGVPFTPWDPAVKELARSKEPRWYIPINFYNGSNRLACVVLDWKIPDDILANPLDLSQPLFWITEGLKDMTEELSRRGQ